MYKYKIDSAKVKTILYSGGYNCVSFTYNNIEFINAQAANNCRIYVKFLDFSISSIYARSDTFGRDWLIVDEHDGRMSFGNRLEMFNVIDSNWRFNQIGFNHRELYNRLIDLIYDGPTRDFRFK